MAKQMLAGSIFRVNFQNKVSSIMIHNKCIVSNIQIHYILLNSMYQVSVSRHIKAKNSKYKMVQNVSPYWIIN